MTMLNFLYKPLAAKTQSDLEISLFQQLSHSVGYGGPDRYAILQSALAVAQSLTFLELRGQCRQRVHIDAPTLLYVQL